MRTLAPVLLTLALLAGCDFTGIATRIVGRTPFTPPLSYAGWWAETETCSGTTGDLSAVRWSLATSIATGDVIAAGLWLPPHDIVLIRGFEESRFTVRHEMLHDLLGGDTEHQSPAWTECDLLEEG